MPALVVKDGPWDESSFDRKMFRVAAGCALAGTVIGLPAGLAHPRPDPDSPTSFLEEIEATGMWLEIHMLAILSYLLLFVTLIGIYRSIKSDRGRLFAVPGLGFAVAGLAFTMAWFAIDGVAVQNITHDYWDASGADRETVFLVANAVEDVIFGFFSGSWIFFWGVPLICFGAAVLVDELHPRWLGWWGLVGGVSCFLTGVAQLYTERDFLVTDVFVPVSSTIAGVWIFAMGVWLWRRAGELDPART